jgi:NhaA family Na+:H+ antiporter
MAQHLHRSFDPERDFIWSAGDGRVEIIWYVDYTCRHTRRIRDIVRRSPTRFGDQGPKVAVRFILPQEGAPDCGADLAIRAAIAAHRQGKFHDMHDALFDAPPRYDAEKIDDLARSLGLDLDRFHADLYAAETDEKIKDDLAALGDTTDLHMPMVFIDNRFYDGTWAEGAIHEAIEKPLGVRLRLAGSDFFHWAAAAGLMLVCATLAALLVANIGLHGWYEHIREIPTGVFWNEGTFSLPLEAWINDGLMALFFLLVGIEIKREIVYGELSDMSRAALPIIGALGGMIAPALIYTAVNFGTDTAHGWGVPMATDIAFTLGIMALLGDKVPVSLKIFVSALAVADDLGAILVIAIFYGEGFHLTPFLIALGILAVMFGLSAGRVYARMPYMILGVVLWYFVHESGLHATLAGVLTAAAIPSRKPADGSSVAMQAAAIVEGEPDRENLRDVAVRRRQHAVEGLREPGFHLQEALENWSNFLILPLFAFFNTGILIVGSSFSPTASESLGVMLGLYIGKPLGIVGIVWIATRLGWAKLSSEISWTQMIGAGFLAGVGFTMSIFISDAAFGGSQLESVKLSVLLASALAAVTGSLSLWFAPRIGAK